MPTTYTDAMLKAEIVNDPSSPKIGYSGKSPFQVAGLLNAANYKAYAPVPVAAVLKWGAANGVLANIQLAATKAAPFAGITAGNWSIALAVQYMLQGGLTSLDVTDPAIVGATSTGAAYTPGDTVTAPGMLDALIAISVMTAAQKDALVALGQYAASRVRVLFGATAPTIDADRVMAVLRS